MDLEQIYQCYFKDVFLYLRSLAASDEIAEEMAQETFVKALKSVDRFDGSKDIRAWLFTIAKNTYYSYCRRQKIYIQENLHQEADPSSLCLSQHLINEESAFLIHNFLHNMQEPYKEIFSLRVFGELPFEKIGILFGKSSGWARVIYHRAKNMILKYMEEIENE